MKFINALSLAPAVNDWLANSHQPRILHVFDHACNLINERREVLSIVTPQIGNGPFNLVIPRLRKSFGRLHDLDESRQTSEVFLEHLSLKSPVSNSPNHLNLGDFAIHTTDAKLWFPRPDWEMLHAKRAEILNQLISLPITQSPVSSLESPILQFSNSLIPSLSTALANADISSAITTTSQLAGLGQGLTPAGDDIIMGAILATWIIHPPEVASVLAEEVARTAAPLTTSLSAAWLNSAGRGEAGILWHNFFDALSSGDSFAIQLSRSIPVGPITKLLSIGHTSGADALAGFIGAFISYAEIETKLCHS